MSVTLRLYRMGKRNMPVYRIVAIDKKKKRNGEYLEIVGVYDPMKTPADLNIDQAKFDKWIEKGAQISEGLTRLLKSKKD